MLRVRLATFDELSNLQAYDLLNHPFFNRQTMLVRKVTLVIKAACSRSETKEHCVMFFAFKRNVFISWI